MTQAELFAKFFAMQDNTAAVWGGELAAQVDALAGSPEYRVAWEAHRRAKLDTAWEALNS